MIVSALRDSGGELPGGFTPVDYIQGDGKAFSVLPQNTVQVDRIDVDFQESGKSTSTYQCVFGAYTPRFFLMADRQTNDFSAGYGNKYIDRHGIDLLRHKTTISNQEYIMDGVLIGRFPGQKNTKSSAIFILSREGKPRFNGTQKIFSMQGYFDGTLLFDLQPAYDTASSRACLYDKIGKKALYNVSGGGEFLWG